MSSADSGLGAGPGGSGRDPVTGLFVAMRDAWLAGVAAMENASRTPATGGEANSAIGSRASSMAAELALPVGRAAIIAANRSVSYWLSLAQIVASHQARSVRAVAAEVIDGSAESEHLVVADELRAMLREVGDLSTREARILQSELAALGEGLAEHLQPHDASAPYRRRWRTKV